MFKHDVAQLAILLRLLGFMLVCSYPVKTYLLRLSAKFVLLFIDRIILAEKLQLGTP